MALLRSKTYISLAENYRQYSALCTVISQKKLLDHTTYPQFVPERGFWEKERKGGYQTKIKVPILQQIKDGFMELKNEMGLLKKEVKELIAMDPLLIARPGKLSNFFSTVSSAPAWFTLHRASRCQSFGTALRPLTWF